MYIPRINIVTDDELWEEIKKIAREQDRSLSYVIRHALTEKFMPSDKRKKRAA